jgi:hypothetical protein
VSIRLSVAEVTPQPPPPEPTVDCHALNYGGLLNSTVQWKGLLQPGQLLTIDRHNMVVAGPQGNVTGTRLPGCDVTVTSITKGIEITELPTTGNGFGSVTLKNATSSPVANPGFQWTVK